LRGLDWLNFFVANFQTGFGPFVSVYLTGAGWTQGAIGAALSAGTIASMVSQIPAGALVDGMRSKRTAAAAAIAAIAASALAIALWPNFLAITLAEVVHPLPAPSSVRRSPQSPSFWSLPRRLARDSAAMRAMPPWATLSPPE
jgi:MFS family permease